MDVVTKKIKGEVPCWCIKHMVHDIILAGENWKEVNQPKA